MVFRTIHIDWRLKLNARIKIVDNEHMWTVCPTKNQTLLFPFPAPRLRPQQLGSWILAPVKEWTQESSRNNQSTSPDISRPPPPPYTVAEVGWIHFGKFSDVSWCFLANVSRLASSHVDMSSLLCCHYHPPVPLFDQSNVSESLQKPNLDPMPSRFHPFSSFWPGVNWKERDVTA